jgi:hypothetical protein
MLWKLSEGSGLGVRLTRQPFQRRNRIFFVGVVESERRCDCVCEMRLEEYNGVARWIGSQSVMVMGGILGNMTKYEVRYGL